MPADQEDLGLASAIDPELGFRDAFVSAMAFSGAGMRDFQILEDVNIAVEVLNGLVDRRRVWRG